MTIRARVLWAAVLSLTAVTAQAGITPAEFAERRARVLALADTDAAVVLRAADFRVRSGDVSFRYRQESNFLYLTGFAEPGLTLMIIPRGVAVEGKIWKVLLFAPAASMRKITAGGTLKDGAVLEAARFDEIFLAAAGSVRMLYVASGDPGFFNDWLNNRHIFLDQEAKQKLREKHTGLRIRNAGPLITPLRERKSPTEIDLIRRSIRMTGDGIRRSMALCRPGRKEYELQAEVEYEMFRQGAAYTSFPSNFGSGPNSLILHYDENRRELRAGEVVVVDVGAEFEGYAADVTRTLPVSGRFTDAGRKVYGIVLKAQQAAIGMIRPGATLSSIEARAREVLGAAGFGRYMPHAVSHHLGIDAHDPGALDTLQAGMAITVEPGIYVPASDTTVPAACRGFGVRIEDDVLVTESGAEVLSSAIPSEIGTVERLVRRAARVVTK